MAGDVVGAGVRLGEGVIVNCGAWSIMTAWWSHLDILVSMRAWPGGVCSDVLRGCCGLGASFRVRFCRACAYEP